MRDSSTEVSQEEYNQERVRVLEEFLTSYMIREDSPPDVSRITVAVLSLRLIEFTKHRSDGSPLSPSLRRYTASPFSQRLSKSPPRTLVTARRDDSEEDFRSSIKWFCVSVDHSDESKNERKRLISAH